MPPHTGLERFRDIGRVTDALEVPEIRLFDSGDIERVTDAAHVPGMLEREHA